MRRFDAPATILARSVETPNQLASWGRIAQLSRVLSDGAGDWVLFKEDREAAYKQLPADPADQRNAILALRRPTTGKWLVL